MFFPALPPLEARGDGPSTLAGSPISIAGDNGDDLVRLDVLAHAAPAGP
jgi:hypothetical protein